MKLISERLREQYTAITHKSGLEIYVFPKKMSPTHALFATRFGAMDTGFRSRGDAEWTRLPDGVAHFLEHKLFDAPDGSDAFSAFSAYGADANAYTTVSRTAYLFSCTENFTASLSELLRFVTTPYFTDETVQKEKGIIAEEIRMYNDNPWERCFANLMRGLYKDHPIRREICGSESSIQGITPELLMQSYNAFYRLSNMALVVCGDVTPEEVLAVADECLPTVADPFDIERRPVSEPDAVHRSSVSCSMQVAKPIFSIGIKDRSIPADPQERLRRDAAMSILEEILFARSGEFYSTLFEEGTLSAAYSYGYSIGEGFGFHTVSGESDDPEAVLQRLREYLKAAARRGIDPADFERCRRVLYADELRAFDSTEEIANNLLSFTFDGCGLFDYAELLCSLTPDDVSALLPELLREDAFCLSVVTPSV